VPQDLFPSPGPDGEEPDGSAPASAGESGPASAGESGPASAGESGPASDIAAGPGWWPDGEWAGPEQGLFVCLPAEELSLAGFAEDGRADTMAPGPLLAEVVHAVMGEDGAGLGALSDDQLTGIISAAQRLESRVAWTRLAALAEFAARRPARPGEARGTGAPASSDGISVFAADELTGELHMTWQSVAGQLAYARAVTGRLPRTFAALAAGKIHPVHVRIIEDETSVLSAANAAKADEELAEAAQSKTFGELRYAAHRLALKLDPEAVRRRKEAASRQAHVRRFREDSGNAGMVARELPPDEVLASWQHVEQRALDLRAAGLPGSLRELRIRAYLDLLQERDTRTAAAGPGDGVTGSGPGPGGGGPDDPPDGGHGPSGPGGDDGPGRDSGPGGNGGNGGPRPDDPAGTSPDSHARRARQDTGPSVAALVTITVPLATLHGDPAAPGEADGYGLLDAQDARDLVAAAARHPDTRWCLTALHPDGTAAAHGCATGQHRWSAGRQAEEFLRALKLTLNPVIRGPCSHAQAQPAYRPSRALRHLVNARNTRCTAPGCGRPAARCDQDHTTPWHHGGLTCSCNIAPLCRHHHRCKQAEGWWLEQPQPGVLIWRVPSGRSYATTPTSYPL
jgi:Domain of unknown function (DUF222)